MANDMVRVRAAVEHVCPVSGMRRTVGEVFELPTPRVGERVRYGFVEVLPEQATPSARKMVPRGRAKGR